MLKLESESESVKFLTLQLESGLGVKISDTVVIYRLGVGKMFGTGICDSF